MASLKTKLFETIQALPENTANIIITQIPTSFAKFSNSEYTENYVCVVEIYDGNKNLVYRGITSGATAAWFFLRCKEDNIPVVKRKGFTGIYGSPHLPTETTIQSINSFMQNYKRGS